MTDDRFPIDFSVEISGTTYKFHPWAGGYEWWNTHEASYKQGTPTFKLVDEIVRLRAELATVKAKTRGQGGQASDESR